jgi:SNF2 family DNA or RNA helicase
VFQAGRDLIRMYEWHYEQIKPNGVVCQSNPVFRFFEALWWISEVRFNWFLQRVPLKNTVKFTVLITSYETLLADAEEISKIRWSVVIVDEGQRLKNRKASVLAALGTLNIRRRVLLSGTPLQNNTEELWSLMNFVEPVRFNSLTDFQKSFGDIQSAGQVEKLAAAIKPYILRRLKVRKVGSFVRRCSACVFLPV